MRSHMAFVLALYDVPQRCILPSLRQRFRADLSPRSQRRLWDLIRLNRYIPLPYDERSSTAIGTENPIQNDD